MAGGPLLLSQNRLFLNLGTNRYKDCISDLFLILKKCGFMFRLQFYFSISSILSDFMLQERVQKQLSQQKR